MFIGKNTEISRRAFMHRSAQLAVAGSASAYALGLAGIGEAAAFSAGNDYKALVCIFLYGGNDHANTLIPVDNANYRRYSDIRGGGSGGESVAVAQSSLGSTVLNQPREQTLTDDMRLALAPTMPGMASLFREGAMAPVLNVGPLIVPLTSDQYKRGDRRNFPRPPKLFSHNDQQSTWQSSEPEGAHVGWGGRMGDLAQSSNTNAMFTVINASGNAVFLSGQNAVPYQVSSGGAVKVRGLDRRVFGSSAASDALNSLLSNHSGHVLEADYVTTMQRSVTYSGFVNDALNAPNPSLDAVPDSDLASQLDVVARLIAARRAMGVKRQVFMVSMGGFDSHDDLLGRHQGLLGKLDSAMTQFYRNTAALGVAESVTTFTASDFGRTLASNGDGSDHGWGGHHFVVGGAVNGGRFYGQAPKISLTSDDQIGQGRLLPTTSVDEYSATLARWFGVANSELSSIAPNIGRFANPDIGFLTKRPS